MKIKELIKELKKFNEDREIYLSQDEEGNEYKKIAEIEDFGEEGSGIVIFPFD